MLWSTDEEEIAAYSNTTFMTSAGEIPRVDRYKYLGIWVDRSLVEHRNISSKEMLGSASLIRNLVMPAMLYGSEWTAYRQDHAEPLQRVVDKAVRWALGMSANSKASDSVTLCHALRIPLVETEMAAMRTRLQAKLEHGHHKMRTWLQILWDDSPRSYPGGRAYTWCRSGRVWVTETLKVRDEGIAKRKAPHTQGVHKYATYRVRSEAEITESAWDLLMSLRGWDNPLDLGWEGPEALSEREYGNGVMPLREWAARAQLYEAHVRSGCFTSQYIESVRTLLVGLTPLGSVPEEDHSLVDKALEGAIYTPWSLIDERKQWLEDGKGHQKRTRREHALVCDIRDCVLERRLSRDKPPKSAEWYNRWGFGSTRDFSRGALQRPDLAEGVRWLISVRVRSFPRVKGVRMQSNRGRNDDSGRRQDLCPLCDSEVEEGWEWCHLALRCSERSVHAAREEFLRKPIQVLERQLDMGTLERRFSETTGLTDQNVRDGVVGIYLVGGVVDSHYDYTCHYGFGMLDIPVFMKKLYEDDDSQPGDNLEVNHRELEESLELGLRESTPTGGPKDSRAFAQQFIYGESFTDYARRLEVDAGESSDMPDNEVEALG
ncbi:hypothetical protein CC2G_015272 [Coprinopsis cinerea AmutBmut pab1-1]|nr:hypothetical protein CC2G_015272 [Coprinopsis cinerea AmutBmut pab1-1]